MDVCGCRSGFYYLNAVNTTENFVFSGNNTPFLEYAVNIQGYKKALFERYKHILGSWRMGLPFIDGTVEFRFRRYTVASF